MLSFATQMAGRTGYYRTVGLKDGTVFHFKSASQFNDFFWRLLEVIPSKTGTSWHPASDATPVWPHGVLVAGSEIAWLVMESER